MRRQLIALLWKEWREGWPVMVPLWLAAPVVGPFVCSRIEQDDRFWAEHRESLLGVAFLCFAAALVAGRLFASEGESGTAKFLLRQPVSRAMVWGAKLLAGVGFLVVLYAAWLPARGSENPFQVYACGYVSPQSTWWPLIAFGAAFLLSTFLDNAVLAFVGGMVAWVPITALVCLACRAAGERSGAQYNGQLYMETVSLAAVLATAAAFLALSYAAFRWRQGRG